MESDALVSSLKSSESYDMMREVLTPFIERGFFYPVDINLEK